MKITFRRYFEFLSERNVIAFQFRANLNSGNQVPFYKLPNLGGNDELRGIENKHLYKDHQSIYAQIEGRQELFWRLGGVLFVGAGQVSRDFSGIKAKNVRFVYGLGGRFRALKEEKLNLRLDVGFTNNGQSAIYLSIKEAF